MKTRTFIFGCILWVVILLVLGSCATMPNPDKMVYEKFCGTWANQDYEPKPGIYTPYAKVIIDPYGTIIKYLRLNQAGLTFVGTYIVEKRWKDSFGNNFYHVKTFYLENNSTWYELWKIDKLNAVFEFNYSNIDYPDAINPKDMHSDYLIYYRY
jgi:hypothetical protein